MEFLSELEKKIENILKYETGPYMGLIEQKTRVRKSHATVPLRKRSVKKQNIFPEVLKYIQYFEDPPPPHPIFCL